MIVRTQKYPRLVFLISYLINMVSSNESINTSLFSLCSIFVYQFLALIVVMQISNNHICNANKTTSTTMSGPFDDYFDEEALKTTTTRRPNPYKNNFPHLVNESIIIKPSEKHTASLIFLHEYGQHSGDLASTMSNFSGGPYMKIIIPTANTIPVSWYNGTEHRSWFDFKNHHYPHDQTDMKALDGVARYMHYLMGEEITKDVDPGRIIIGGIAQGAAVALHAALTFPERIGAVVVLSPWNPSNETINQFLKNPVNKNIPIFLAHVQNNKYTSDSQMAEMLKQLKEKVSKFVEFRSYPQNGTQPVTNDELEDMRKFNRRKVEPIYS